MDEEKHDVPSPPPNRKRKTSDINDDDCEDEHDIYHESFSPLDTPSKRLRNPQGNAVERKELRFNHIHELFSNLAFTRLYVTANYDRYSTTQSPVLLCVLYRHDALYRAVW